MVGELTDPRRASPPHVADERTMLDAWLEFHRVTLLLKCEGLDDAGRKARPVATSQLSLHGLVRHMADVERNWFQRVLGSDATVESIYWRVGVEDSELVPLDAADWEGDVATWQRECEASRSAARVRSLDDVGERPRDGARISLRWIYVHMIEEYARHNGHADLIREMIDGAVGD